MRISTIIYNDGEERQFVADSVSVGDPSENLIKISLQDGSELIIPIYAIKTIYTSDLPDDAISAEILGG